MQRVFWGIALSVLLAGSANAALLSRAGGQAYYDDDLNVTWIANANLAAGSIYDDGASTTDGRMTWASATSWIASLNVANHLGVSSWQLPEANVACTGFFCSSADMYHLFSNEGINDAAPSPLSNVGGASTGRTTLSRAPGSRTPSISTMSLVANRASSPRTRVSSPGPWR